MSSDRGCGAPLTSEIFSRQGNPLWTYISYDPCPTRKVELPLWLWSMFIELYTYHLYGLIAIANISQYSNDLNDLSEYWDQWKFRMKLPVFNWQQKSGKCHRVTEDAGWLHKGMGGHNIEELCVKQLSWRREPSTKYFSLWCLPFEVSSSYIV